MSTPLDAGSPGSLADADLLALLGTEGDRLPRAVVDEILRRRDRMVAPLAAICKDERAWEDGEGPAVWKPVHATFILGAIGGEPALEGVLAAVRHAVASETEWVTDFTAPILANVGKPAVAPLRQLALDREAAPELRVEAISGLGAIAARYPDERVEILPLVRKLMTDGREDEFVRQIAASTLLDHAAPEDKRPLLKEARRERRESESPMIGREGVEAAYARGTPDFHEYERDWLEFYDPARIAARELGRKVEEEWDRWETGIQDEEPWVGAACDEALERYARTLEGLSGRAEKLALRVARSMVTQMVEEEGFPPWSWDGWAVEQYFDRLAEGILEDLLDDGDSLASIPDHMLRFARFWVAEGKLSPEEMQEVEETIEAEREHLADATEERDADLARSGELSPCDPEPDLGAELEMPFRAPPRVGRNEPCPCGSGKKYKKCCGGSSPSAPTTS